MDLYTFGFWTLLGMLGANILAVTGFVAALLRRKRRNRLLGWLQRFMRTRLLEAGSEEIRPAIRRNPELFLETYIALCDTLSLPEECQAALASAFRTEELDSHYLGELFSKRRHTRSKAAVYLGYIGSDTASRALIFALERERFRAVKLHIVFGLCRLGDPAAIPSIVDTLAGEPTSYQMRALGMLLSFNSDLDPYIGLLLNRDEEEIVRLIVKYAARRPSRRLRDYLLEIVRTKPGALAHDATRILMTHYVHQIEPQELLGSSDVMIRNLAAEALGSRPTRNTVDLLLPLLDDEKTRKSAIVGITQAAGSQPSLFTYLTHELLKSTTPLRRDGILETLSVRVEYFLGRTESAGLSTADLVDMLTESGRSSGIIAFLNRNRDPEVEGRLLGILGPILRSHPERADGFRTYLRRDLVPKLALEEVEARESRATERKHISRPAILAGILFLVLVVPPAAYLLWHRSEIPTTEPVDLLLGYGTVFGLFFAGYALVLNLTYLLLLIVSGIEVRRQQRHLDIKPLAMLFQENMLPSITIIAPAFRESETIVESVNSLLNLRYPDYEVIVVNDGSPDDTLQVLMDTFELERTDVFVHGYLQTQPIRGVYRNPRIPELLVIDKENGGKADSLNAGINAARKEYFAGIDSDSLLERDSLLRLTAHFLDVEEDVIATGGNIFPVNGCSVEDGHLDSIGLPRNTLARFQTMEYIRSFMAGRTAWSRMQSLLIISGAFGLFRKEEVVRARGYLTRSEAYGRDTVGEDMELVVRVSKMLRNEGKSSLVQYSYSANCWTEVPESRRILSAQRDRWQRGLIEIILLHGNMLFRPRYGVAGTIGMPYFLIFEVVGPWIELQGYLWLAVGLFLGVLSPGVLMLMTALTIPLGMLVSVASLILAEWHTQYFRPIDKVRLVLLAFLENFGYRQYVSFLRVRGFVSALRRRSGSGAMGRRGFTISKRKTK
jgi:peptidoglycan-N-acetylglucosamine deacetylase